MWVTMEQILLVRRCCDTTKALMRFTMYEEAFGDRLTKQHRGTFGTGFGCP